MKKLLVSAVGILMLAFACSAETEYTVGGDLGWTGPPNITAGYYESWAANNTFRGGDTLKFVFNGTHSMMSVSKHDYDNCTKVPIYFTGPPGTIFKYTFPTNANGMYYFICTVDSHCEDGQKLAVNVTALTSSPADRTSPSSMITALVVSASSAIIPLAAHFMFS